jgi:hypothetical protein
MSMVFDPFRIVLGSCLESIYLFVTSSLIVLRVV